MDPDSEVTYQFLEEVFSEIAEISPGPYVHFGGDEVETMPTDRYREFVRRIQEIVRRIGKTPIGWREVAATDLLSDTIVQYRDVRGGTKTIRAAVRKGTQLILSPGNRTYLDMKYDADSRIGNDWAGYVRLCDAYDWDPATVIDGISEVDVRGVEAALWTEYVATLKDLEFMLMPRPAALAEVAWSAQDRSPGRTSPDGSGLRPDNGRRKESLSERFQGNGTEQCSHQHLVRWPLSLKNQPIT